MAVTNKVLRGRVNEILDIRRVEIPKLQAELDRVARLLGAGTYRSLERPGFVVTIGNTSGGGDRVEWKQVAMDLARRLNMTESELTQMSKGYRTYVFPGSNKLSVRITKDTCKNHSKAKGVIV